MLRSAMKKSITSDGFVVVGFPRNIQQVGRAVRRVLDSVWCQVESFQEKIITNCPPVTVLLDCSELELARNLGQRRARIDDNKVRRTLCTLHYSTIQYSNCEGRGSKEAAGVQGDDPAHDQVSGRGGEAEGGGRGQGGWEGESGKCVPCSVICNMCSRAIN